MLCANESCLFYSIIQQSGPKNYIYTISILYLSYFFKKSKLEDDQ